MRGGDAVSAWMSFADAWGGALAELAGSNNFADATNGSRYNLEVAASRVVGLSDAAIARGTASVERGWEVAESPIERLLLPFLVFQDYGALGSPATVATPEQGPSEMPTGSVFIFPQFGILRYRLDFLVVGSLRDGRQLAFAVECDGRDFHNVGHDWHRDNALREVGVLTIRATGSEIHASPASVATRLGWQFAEWAGA